MCRHSTDSPGNNREAMAAMQPQADGAPAIPAEVEDVPMPPQIQCVVEEVADVGGEHTPVPVTVSPIRAAPMPVELARRPAPIVETRRFDTDLGDNMWELVENGRVIARQLRDYGPVNIGHISLAQLIPDDADDAEGNGIL